MADYTTIDNPGLFFNTVLYSGTGSSNSVTGVGFQPDWTWIKQRNGTTHHFIYDAVRGATNTIYTSATSADAVQSQGLTAFGTDGFTVGTNTGVNGAGGTGGTYAAWNWLGANGTVSNSDGSITSTVSANQTAGFSIVTYTSNSTSSNETVGHGLGVKPDMVITKNRDTAYNWDIYHSSLGYNANLIFTDAATRSGAFGTSEPTSTVFRTSPSFTTNLTNKYVAYCFAGKQGYSKFGKYTGNGNASGAFIYTGFSPAFIIIKRTDTTAEWHMIDNKRNTFNTVNNVLSPNTTGSEATTSSNPIDFTSQGFKCKGTGTQVNADGGSFIYMAFAEHPFVTAGTKAAGTAR
jgi:hypothetical protein